MFAPDTEASLLAAVALINTLPDASDSGEDELPGSAELTRYLDEWGYTGDRLGTRTELRTVQELRHELRDLLTTPADRLPGEVNTVLANDHAVPQLVKHEPWGWHLHATPASAPLAVRIRVECAMALVDLIRRDEADRIKVCAADDCAALLVDLSKNRSKRFCDVGNCGNRANVSAYRARKASQAAAENA